MHFLKKFIPSFILTKLFTLDKELLSGSSIFMITKVIGVGLTYLFAWFIASKMGASKWGFITLMITTLNVISIVTLFGFDVLLIKYGSEYKTQNQFSKLRNIYLKTLFYSLGTVILVTSIFLLFPAFFSQLLFGKSNLSPWLIVTAIGLPANIIFQLNNAVLVGIKDMVYYCIYKNILLFGLTLVAYYLLNITLFPIYLSDFQESGILILVTYVCILYLGSIFNGYRVIKKTQLLKGERNPSLSNSEMFQQSFPFLLAASMTIILTTTDYFMLSHFTTNVEIGLYDIAVKISLISSTILMAVNSIATPKFSEFYSNNDNQALKNIVHQSSKMIFWGSAPILVIILIFPTFFLELFGPEFKIAASALIFLTLGQMINTLCGPNGNLLKMTNNQKAFQFIILGAALLDILLNYVLIPIYGFKGAAISSMISMFFWNIGGFLYAYFKLGISTFYIPFYRTN